MDMYLKAEKRLAELLGYTEITIQKEHQRLMGDYGGIDFGEPIPRWTREWSACGPLITAHDFTIICHPKRVAVVQPLLTNTFVAYDEHPDRTTALRYALVLATIKKLESKTCPAPPTTT